MKFSIVIPVYNRPNEINSLIQSITNQSFKDLEILVVEDGSVISSEKIIDKFKENISLKYYKKRNEGPGLARNYGAKFALGEWIIFLDSDCIIPVNYFDEINRFLRLNKNVDFFGGPDRANKNFTFLQKSINYSMTSMLTSGGIRGSKFSIDKFLPRSFNMGVKKKIFDQVKGFSSMRFGEDLDLSYRLISVGAKSTLIPEAFVYHQRRNDLKGFSKQIYSSGFARVILNKKHKGTFRFFHLFPSFFILFFVLVHFLLLFKIDNDLIKLIQFIYGFYFILIFIESSILNKNPLIGLLSIVTTFTQFLSYGIGYLRSIIKVYL